MKMEQILINFWKKGLFFNKNIFNLHNKSFFSFLDSNWGLSFFWYFFFSLRFNIVFNKAYNFYLTSLVTFADLKTFNKLLSIYFFVYAPVQTTFKYNLIFFFLLKLFKGKRYLLRQPIKGQRTWSNAWTSFKLNIYLAYYVNKKLLQTRNTSSVINQKRFLKKMFFKNTLFKKRMMGQQSFKRKLLNKRMLVQLVIDEFFSPSQQKKKQNMKKNNIKKIKINKSQKLISKKKKLISKKKKLIFQKYANFFSF